MFPIVDLIVKNYITENPLPHRIKKTPVTK